MRAALPDAIATDLAELLVKLDELHFAVVHYDYAPQSFGNYFVDVTDRRLNLRIVRDRGQYSLDGPENELRGADLWRAFDVKTEFQHRLLTWLADRAAFIKR